MKPVAESAATTPATIPAIGNLPVELPRIVVVIEPDSLICPCCCGEMHRIGGDRRKRLDIVPPQLRVIVIVTVRPKYACRPCTDGVVQALAPAHLVMAICRPRLSNGFPNTPHLMACVWG